MTRISRRVLAAAVVADVGCVLLFTALGRSSHHEGLGLAGWARTAWPFLAGLAVGWAVVRLLRWRWPVDVRGGVAVWLSTVVVGMVLRVVSGQGTAAAFVAVALVVLAFLLLGWRGLVETNRWLQSWLERKGHEAAAREHREGLAREAGQAARQHER